MISDAVYESALARVDALENDLAGLRAELERTRQQLENTAGYWRLTAGDRDAAIARAEAAEAELVAVRQELESAKETMLVEQENAEDAEAALAAVRAQLAETVAALTDRAEKWEREAEDGHAAALTYKGHDVEAAVTLDRQANRAAARAAELREILALVSVREQPPPRYDLERDEWSGQCPYGDDCTGCDAQGYCEKGRAEAGEQLPEPDYSLWHEAAAESDELKRKLAALSPESPQEPR